MRKFAFIWLVLLIAVSLTLAFPATLAADDPLTLSVVSDTSVEIEGVYNKYGGDANYVDLSGSGRYAVLAAEPKPYPTGYASEPPETTGSAWDSGTGNYFATTNPGADWIWETEKAEDPADVYGSGDALYDPDASSNGRVVVFQKSFMIPGDVEAAALHITADNCYEVWINGVYVTRSSTAKTAGWATSNLHEDYVGSTGWQTVGHYTDLAAYLNSNDTNTIRILAGNEYYHPSNSSHEYNNSPCPPYLASPYRQQNPGALIFKLDIDYTENPPVPPVPEVPALVLLSLGLAGLGGFILFTHRSGSTVAR